MSQFDSKTAGSVRCLEQTVSPMPGETCSPVVWVFPWFVIESFPSLLLHQAAPLPVSSAKKVQKCWVTLGWLSALSAGGTGGGKSLCMKLSNE